MREKGDMTSAIVSVIQSTIPEYSTEQFIDLWLTPNLVKQIDDLSMERWIHNADAIPSVVGEKYEKRSDYTGVKNKLGDWYKANTLQSDQILKDLKNLYCACDQKNIVENIEKMYMGTAQAETMFELMWHGIRQSYIVRQENKKTRRENHCCEMDELVLYKYGISSEIGKVIIRQLAANGQTDNPYILYGAAELEEEKALCFSMHNAEISNTYFDKAYEYYEKASKQEFPMAYWAMGHLVKQHRECTARITILQSKTEQELWELEIEYYKRAAGEKCAKAVNSLGNIAMTISSKNPLRKKLFTGKWYYKYACKLHDIHAYYNYARCLEKELIKDTRNIDLLSQTYLGDLKKSF